MNDAKYMGLDVHQATISATVLDSTGKFVMAAIPEIHRSDSTPIRSARTFSAQYGCLHDSPIATARHSSGIVVASYLRSWSSNLLKWRARRFDINSGADRDAQ